jgi:predicted TIM-barrel fold metal-dependent hydrolase
MIVDAHVHIGAPPPEAEPDNFVKLMNKSEIDKSIICRYIPEKPTLIGNKLVFSAISEYPDRFIGFVWIDPNDKTAIKEIEKAVNKWRFNGIKLHLETMFASEEKLSKIFAEAERLGVPIYIHVGEHFKVVDNLSGQFNVNIILGHLGVGVYNLNPSHLMATIKLAKKQSNIYLETSGNTYFFIEYALKKLGSSKLIFGSDFPHEHPLVMINTINILQLTKREKLQILGENIKKIINI